MLAQAAGRGGREIRTRRRCIAIADRDESDVDDLRIENHRIRATGEPQVRNPVNGAVCAHVARAVELADKRLHVGMRQRDLMDDIKKSIKEKHGKEGMRSKRIPNMPAHDDVSRRTFAFLTPRLPFVELVGCHDGIVTILAMKGCRPNRYAHVAIR